MSPGRIAYEAYSRQSGTDKSLAAGHNSEWEEQDPKIREAWEFAAAQVLQSRQSGTYAMDRETTLTGVSGDTGKGGTHKAGAGRNS
jgi:hypothetical protein